MAAGISSKIDAMGRCISRLKGACGECSKRRGVRDPWGAACDPTVGTRAIRTAEIDNIQY